MEATASDMELAIAASYIDLSWQDGTSDLEVWAADEFARLTPISNDYVNHYDISNHYTGE